MGKFYKRYLGQLKMKIVKEKEKECGNGDFFSKYEFDRCNKKEKATMGRMCSF